MKNEDKHPEIFGDKAENYDYLIKLLPDVFMSNGDVTKFDPKHILNTVIKETGLNLPHAKKVTELVVRRIIASGIKFLSGPHIRELVCSALSELGFGEERKKYTRIGLPVFDYKNLVNTPVNTQKAEYTTPQNIEKWTAGQISREYSLLGPLNGKYAAAHLSGTLHIHAADHFDLKPTALVINADALINKAVKLPQNYAAAPKNPDNIKDAVTLIYIAAKSAAASRSGEIYINNFNIALAPFANNSDYPTVKKYIYYLIYLINTDFYAGAKVPNISLVTAPFIPENMKNKPILPEKNGGKTYGDYGETARMIFRITSEIFAKGDDRGKVFAFPKHRVIFDPNLQKDIYDYVFSDAARFGTPIFINADNNVKKFGYAPIYPDNENPTDDNTADITRREFSALQSVAINLPKIAYNSGGDAEKFIQNMYGAAETAAEIMLVKRKLIEKLSANTGPYFAPFGYNPTDPNLIPLLLMDFTGLAEAVLFLTGKKIGTDRAADDTAQQIIKKLAQKCGILSKIHKIPVIPWEYPSYGTPYRFARLDLEHNREAAVKIVNGNIETEEVYYTPSLHVPYNSEIQPQRRISAEAKLTAEAGSNFTLPLWLAPSEENGDPEKLRKSAEKIAGYGIPGFMFAFDFTVCPVCGHFGKNTEETCTKCKTKNITKLARAHDIYIPVELLNPGKKIEIKQRFRYSRIS